MNKRLDMEKWHNVAVILKNAKKPISGIKLIRGIFLEQYLHFPCEKR